MTWFYTLLLSMAIPLVCRAGGYALHEMDAAGVGMADAYICRVDDPSAVWYNPAALTRLDGNQLTINTTLQNNSTDFQPRLRNEPVQSGSIHTFPSNFFFSHQISEDSHFGIGIYNPFGVHTQWPPDSVAALVSSKFDLRTFFVTPSIGFRLTPNVSIGGGVDFIISHLDADKNINLPLAPATITQQLSLKGNDFGFNVGALIETNHHFQFGATYKSHVDVSFNGSVVFLNVPAASRPVFADGGANITLPLPSQIMVGAGARLENFSFEGDANYTRWREFDVLRLSFDRNTPPDQNLRRGFQSTWNLRFGADYRWKDHYIFRAGVFHDPSPVPDKAVDPILPDASSNGFSAGVGYTMGQWTFNASYMTAFFSNRTSPLDNFSANPLAAGDYKNHAHYLSFGFAYRFSKE